jgi:hypothetical protein
MGMVYFLDNDVILKLTTYRMLNQALNCLENRALIQQTQSRSLIDSEVIIPNYCAMF